MSQSGKLIMILHKFSSTCCSYNALCDKSKYHDPMMTSSKGNIFRVTGPLWGESTGHRFPKGQWRGALMFSLICAWTNGWAINRDTGDLRRHRAHYDATVLHKRQHRRYLFTAITTSQLIQQSTPTGDPRIDWPHFDGLVQDCSNSIANALELLQYCLKPSIWQND